MARKRRNPFGFGFGFDEDDFGFGSNIFEEMERMMKGMRDIDFEDIQKGNKKSFVWGFNAKVGPEGKWEVEEFGNKPGVEDKRGRKTISEEREPLVDIIEGKDTITVIAEVPGVSKGDIKLKGSEKSLEIEVDTPSRKYHKKISLPCDVKSMTAKANYKNGVLEVTIERVEKKKEEREAGKRIKID